MNDGKYMEGSINIDNLVQVIRPKKVDTPPTVTSPKETTAQEVEEKIGPRKNLEAIASDNTSKPAESPQPEVPKENFRTQLTEKYNWFLQHFGGMVNGRVMIYEIPGFTGDWAKVSPQDYYAYRLSIKGLKPENGQESATLQQVVAELDKDRATGSQRGESLSLALRVYYGVEDDSKLELNNFVWVSHARMRELVTNTEFPAAGAFKYGEHIGVLLNAESTKDAKEFSAEVAHEVGHFERMKSGKDDTNKDQKKVRLEEGIVQANAINVAEKGGFQDAKSLEVYDFETSVVMKLAEKLGVDLMSYSHAEIEQLMKLIPTTAEISSNPYQYLVDNLDSYIRAVGEVDKAGDNIDPKRLNELALQFTQAENAINKLLE